MKVTMLDHTNDPECLIGQMAATGAKSGVYEIRLATDGRSYIGSAIDIAERWNRHKKDLRRGKHHSIQMQRAWDKHGPEAFQFRILELCEGDKDAILALEQRYLDTNSPELNTCRLASSPLGIKHSSDTKKKVSDASKNMWASDGFKEKHAAAMASAVPKMRAAANLQKDERSRRMSEFNGSYWTDEARMQQSIKRSAYAKTDAGLEQLRSAGRSTWDTADKVSAATARRVKWARSDAGKASMARATAASNSPESKAKRAEAVSIRVTVTTTSDGSVAIFSSMKEAAAKIGVTVSCVSSAVKRGTPTRNGYLVEKL